MQLQLLVFSPLLLLVLMAGRRPLTLLLNMLDNGLHVPANEILFMGDTCLKLVGSFVQNARAGCRDVIIIADALAAVVAAAFIVVAVVVIVVVAAVVFVFDLRLMLRWMCLLLLCLLLMVLLLQLSQEQLLLLLPLHRHPFF